MALFGFFIIYSKEIFLKNLVEKDFLVERRIQHGLHCARFAVVSSWTTHGRGTTRQGGSDLEGAGVLTLEPNQPIQIVLANRVVPSRLIRVMRTEIYIDALKETEIELTPLPGQKIFLRWVEDETLLQQLAVVVDVLDPIPLIVVKLEDAPMVVEFRKSFRVKVALPIEYRLVRPDSEVFLTTTQDISSTGLRFPSAIKLWAGISLRVRVRVESRDIDLVGKVVHVTAKARALRGRESWETGLQFVTIPLADRRFLEEYVRRQHARAGIRGGGTASVGPKREIRDSCSADIINAPAYSSSGDNE